MSSPHPAHARIGVVGAGVMGAGIAQALATGGNQVVCVDKDPAQLERARQTVVGGRYGLERSVERGRLTAEDAQAVRDRLELSPDLDAAAACDVVVEAVPEDIGLKITLFRELDRLAAPHTVLCSNSSGLPIAAFAAATDRRGQVLGWHWASPAPVMALAEIVRTEWSEPWAVDLVSALATRAGKNPVVVNDSPLAWGYVANRIYAAMFREAERVVADGVANPEQVDQLMRDCYRWPAGPFALVQGARTGWREPAS